jgi:DNA-binding response OmpR family regulator
VLSTIDTPAPDEGQSSGEPDRRPTLLLVDDDTMVGRMIGHAAEECGFHALRANSGEGFRRIFRARQPACVALDLCMPGADGVEIIRFLAEERFAGQVIIISGLHRHILDAALRLGRALGLDMAEPLGKPFRFADLARRLVLKPEGVA